VGRRRCAPRSDGSGPRTSDAITTLVDATGLFIYFTVAHLTIAQLTARPDTAAPYDCAVVEVRRTSDPPGEELEVIAPCDPSKPAVPCWRIKGEDESRKPHFRLSIDRGATRPAADAQIRTTCVAAPPVAR
jgi:hypothetical protein